MADRRLTRRRDKQRAADRASQREYQREYYWKNREARLQSSHEQYLRRKAAEQLDPELRERRLEAARRNCRRYWLRKMADPAERERIRRDARERYRKKRSDPEYRARERERQRTPEARARMRNWRRRKAAEDPEWRERQRRVRQQWVAAHLDHVRERRNRWYARHPETARAYTLKKKFGITPTDYAAQLAAQGGRCAICGSKEAGGRGNIFAVDHDHISGKWRGLLCAPCNTGLGHLRDSPKLVVRARKYLETKTRTAGRVLSREDASSSGRSSARRTTLRAVTGLK